ncbi:MAG: energy transducer TonB [Flavipsychrobacter sp.]|nr:energy transducer TonB [Flavipsychrobacter sp.]
MQKPIFHLFTIALLFISFLSSAQDTVYFDKQWKPCTHDEASYYRLRWMQQDGHYKVEDHYWNGKIQMTGSYLTAHINDSEVKDGYFVFYDSTGFKESEENYKVGRSVGTWKYYFKKTTGLRSMVEYLDDSNAYWMFFDSVSNTKSAEGIKAHGERIGLWKFYFRGTNDVWITDFYNSDSSTYFTYYDSITHKKTKEGAYKNKRDIGQWKYYFKTGELKTTVDYMADSVKYIVAFDSVKQTKKSEGVRTNEIRTGIWKFYYPATHILKSTEEYLPDSTIYFTYFDSIPNTKKSEGKRQKNERIDLWKFYFANTTNVKATEEYKPDSSIYSVFFDSLSHLATREGVKKNGENRGQWKYYYNGTNDLKALLDYRPDSSIYCIYYDSTHFRVSEGTKKNGEKVGEWKTYFKNTNDVASTIFIKSPELIYCIFYDSLTLDKFSEGARYRGENIGVWKYYSAEDTRRDKGSFQGKMVLYSFKTGKIEREDIYKDDSIVSGHCYNASGREIPYVKTYMLVQEDPFAGFDLKQYMKDHLRYPPKARSTDNEAYVLLTFTISEDGSISNPEVISGTNADYNAEAIRMVLNMPHWHPGRQHNQPVKSIYMLSVPFSKQ